LAQPAKLTSTNIALVIHQFIPPTLNVGIERFWRCAKIAAGWRPYVPQATRQAVT
jgi:hypothetical protein